MMTILKILLRNKVGKEKVISLVPDDFNISNLNKNEKIWNRTKQLEQDNIEKKDCNGYDFCY